MFVAALNCRIREAAALALVLIVGVATLTAEDTSDHRQEAMRILDETGVQGGLIVHLGCGDGALTGALRPNDRYQVHGLDRDARNVQRSRNNIRSRGLYGNVSADLIAGNRLPYVDNLVNLIVAEQPADIATEEMLRVLAPNGLAYIREDGQWKKLTKPRPESIDEWTHFMHDATGNAVAHDTEVGPPQHLQWIGSPQWSRHHDRMASMSALVSSGGRIFYIMDEGSRVSIQLPPKWTLIARDAFNGSVLWKRPIPTWHSHLWPLKSGPTQLARRLIATPDRVYVTLGLRAPLTALDAATGETVRTYEESHGTEEIVYSDGTLFAMVNPGESELEPYIPQLNVGDQQRVSREFLWNQQRRRVMALDADGGRTLWSMESRVSPITLAADGQRVFFHDGESIVCVDRTTGQRVWNSPPAPRRQAVTMNFGPKLVVHDDVVLYAGGDRKMQAFSVETGQQLWTAPHAQSGYLSPEDLLVVNGLVWSAPTTTGQLSGIFTGRDPKTGEVKKEFPPDVETYWFHHRCHMAKATDRFLLPSRTGIEFVDPQSEHWDINHWVRGGCLYGIMPCNGLVYAPPHNCACYPESKLFGLNALAAARDIGVASPDISDVDAVSGDRLQLGPAYDMISAAAAPTSNSQPNDWPTYRHDTQRSGRTKTPVPTDLSPAWQTELEGRLSSPTISDGRLYVAQIDAHTVHALDAATGEKQWSFTVGGRVDSPPTIHKGRVLFGSADGHVYCLRASDGELAWRFRAAPQDQRLMAFEQLESVWPVHGSVMVQDDAVYCVAGRSNYLDGGLRWLKLDAQSGRKLAEAVIDERDPQTGENLQARLQILNMPVGLPDILSSDGRYVYMRSQRFDKEGNRQELGPHSGQPAEQGSAQHGAGAHLFAPMGFLDGTWFHRAYWVYGRSFAGGHGGYYQAGKFAPSGRILVFNDDNVFGFGRKPQYYRWTTTMEHQLFAASKEPPEVAQSRRAARRGGGSVIRIEKSASLNPTGQVLAVEAWVRAERPNGVILARGGPTYGYALIVQKGRPHFVVRAADEKVASVTGKRRIVGDWTHVAGVLTDSRQLQLYVNGELTAASSSGALIESDPAQAMEIGADEGGAVGSYQSPNAFTGAIDEVRVYHGKITLEEIKARYLDPNTATANRARLVAAYSFDDKDAKDSSGNENHGQVAGVTSVPGKSGSAMRFTGRTTANRTGGSFVEHHWTQDLPLFVHAMVLADNTLFVAGPPDVINEEETFQRITARDPQVQAKLAEQAAILDGQEGALLLAVSTEDGATLAEHRLPSLPTWDGMAAAEGRLYLSTKSGQVVCFRGRQ